MLGEILVAQGHLDEVAFRALLLSHSRSGQPLGEFLVEQGVIGRDVLDRALALQSSLQPTLLGLLAKDAGEWRPRVTPEEKVA
jgi:adsorption protein B